MKPLQLLALALSVAVLGGCALLTPLPETASLDERLKRFPTRGLPLSAPATIHWNEHQVPFIEAASDQDLAFALGLVHAHLRLAQMTILRGIVEGRLSESAGPIAVDIDHALRILNFGRGTAEFEAAMPAETRAFVEAFVRGVNHYQDGLAADDLPHEFAVLRLKRALGLAGWVLDSPTLRTAISGYASMKANSAIGLIVAGLVLFLIAACPAGTGTTRLLRRAGAAVAIAIGAGALAQFIGRIDLGIDQFLVRDPFTPVEFSPGRVPRATAVGFLVFGFAVLFSLRRPSWAFWVGYALTATGFWTSLFVCMGFMFNVQSLYGSTWFGSVAIHTAFAFLALFAGTMLAIPDRGWARIVFTNKVGGVVARRVLPLIAVVPIGILWLANIGTQLGLYGERASEYVAAVALLIVLTTLTLVMCGRLNVLDAQRRLMEDGRHRAQAEALRMRHMAEVDPLTDLWNRRHFLAEADQQIAAAHSAGAPLVLLMIDIDHFKRINDTHGHASGDKALCLLAATLKDYTRKDDCVARLGGEEFAVLLPGASRMVAYAIAERFRQQVARVVILDGEGRSFSFTVSVGLGELRADDAKPEDLLARADAALYTAKRGGRNRVEIAFAPERSAA